MNEEEKAKFQAQAREGIYALIQLSFEYIDKHLFAGAKHPDVGVSAITIQLSTKIEQTWILMHNDQAPGPIQIPTSILLGIKSKKEKK